MTTVNLVGLDNGVGLSRDTQLLADAFRAIGCTVTVSNIDTLARRRRRSTLVQLGVHARQWAARRRRPAATDGKFDVNIMLEHLWPEHFELARQNIALPNPEWFDRNDRRFLYAVDQVWAKTANTENIFQDLGCSVMFTGFDSQDRHDATITREPAFFHLAGKSPLKGTELLLALWQRHAEWPLLTVVQSRPSSAPAPEASNICYCARYLDDDELRVLQNRHLFHICASASEGWGHYIAEALSAGAIVLATDAPPMNELVTAERGILVPYRNTSAHKSATAFHVAPDQLERAVVAALALNAGDRKRLSDAARIWFLENKRRFGTRLAEALDGVLRPVRR